MVRLAAGVEEITPLARCPLAGFQGRHGDFARVADPLELNALVIRCGDAAAVVMTADLLFVSEEMKAEIWRRSGAGSAIDYGSFLCAASHTHFAPAVDDSKPLLGEVSAAYLEYCVEKGARLLERLIRSPGEGVTVEHGSGWSPRAVNRRRRDDALRWGFPPVHRRINLAPNPAGKSGGFLHSVTFRRADGSLAALLWNYPCHPVSFPERNAVSADFPGVARRVLRDELGGSGEALPVLFLQGFSGDLRPPAVVRNYPATVAGAKQYLYDLVNGRSFGAFSPEAYREWSAALAADLLKVVQSATAVPEVSLQARSESVPLEVLMAAAPAGRRLHLQRVSLGATMHIIGLSAEPVIDYLDELARIFPGETVIAAGCLADLYGYLPTAEMLGEGGYEAAGFCAPFGLAGNFKDSLQETVREALERLRVG